MTEMFRFKVSQSTGPYSENMVRTLGEVAGNRAIWLLAAGVLISIYVGSEISQIFSEVETSDSTATGGENEKTEVEELREKNAYNYGCEVAKSGGTASEDKMYHLDSKSREAFLRGFRECGGGN